MTKQQVERIDAVPHGSRAVAHLVRDGLTIASVKGLLHARAEGHAEGTPWLFADFAGAGSTFYLHPSDPVVVVKADAATGLVVRVEL